MTRTELKTRINDKRPCMSYELSSTFVDTLLEQMKDEISRKGRIQLRGFGSFFVKTYKNWATRNPMSGLTINKRVRIRVCFRVSPRILKSLNNIGK